jgi:hypothetical protein
MAIKISEPVEFFCESNYYLIDGIKYPRVTRIKSVINNPGLSYWQSTVGKKKANEIMKKRGDFGTRIHKLIQITLNGEKVDLKNYDEETETTMKLFKDFLVEHDLQPELVEQHLWFKLSEKYRYAGTADFIGYVDGKLMLLDWKTSKAIYPDMWLQLSAYIVAFEALTGERLDGCGILQIRDGKKKYVTKTYEEMMEEFEVFKAALVIYNRYRKIK